MADKKENLNEEIQRVLQEKSLQLILLDNQLKKIEEQYRILDEHITNIYLTRQNLDKIKKANEIFAGVAEGIFIKANITDKQKVLVNVGKGIVIETTIEEAKRILDARMENLAMIKVMLSKEAEKILNEIETMEKTIKELTK